MANAVTQSILVVGGGMSGLTAAIEAAEVIIALDGLPPEHIHCATLAVNTLREAIVDCQPEGGGRSE